MPITDFRLIDVDRTTSVSEAGNGVGDWATLFKNFIYRDVAFILGGSIVLESFASCLPVVEARLADPVLAAKIGRFNPSLVLLQDRNDLLFRMPLALHRLVLSQGQTPVHPGSIQWGNVTVICCRAVGAMVMRAHQLVMLSDQAAQYLWKYRTMRGWHRREPLDLPAEAPIEEPRLLKRSIEMIVQANVRSKTDLLESDISHSTISRLPASPDVSP